MAEVHPGGEVGPGLRAMQGADEPMKNMDSEANVEVKEETATNPAASTTADQENAGQSERAVSQQAAGPAEASTNTTRGAYALREMHLINLEASGELKFVYAKNDGNPQNMMWLVALKNIFSKQLPNMPKDYICRLVFERRHRSVAVISKGKCMGGITYRTFPGTSASTLGEIAFCAVTASEQVKGYGTRLMNCTKEYARTVDRLTHFLTYADNNAVGYFAKQGFTKQVTLEREKWAGFIKDYDGGTLMEFVIHPRVTYDRLPQMLQSQLAALEGRLKSISNSHVVHPPLRTDRSVPFQPVAIDNIPGVTEAGFKPNAAPSFNVTVHGQVVPATKENLQIFMGGVLDLLRSQEQIVWPFLKPVSVEDASDYYTIIKNPMDLETVATRLASAAFYINLDIFLADLKRIWDNARLYNAEDTVYFKYACQLEKIVEAHVLANVHR